MDTSYKQQNNITPVSSFETIDTAVFTWLDEELDIHTISNDGVRKVPVNWFSRERSFQIKVEKDDRDSNGILDFPQIQLTRTTTKLTDASERPIPGIIKNSGDYKNNQFGFWRKVNQSKTKNFANAKAKRIYGQPNYKLSSNEVVNEWVFTPYPAYYDITYELAMKALYMQQINEMTAPFHRRVTPYNTKVFMIHNGGFKYEAFIEPDLGFTSNAPNIDEAERTFEAKFILKVLGFTTTSGVNQKTPNIVYRDGPAKVRIQRERTIIGDINTWGDPDTPYRE